MLYSGAAASLQGLMEHNENCDDDGDDDIEYDDDGDDDDDSDEDEDVMLAWWKQPLKEFNLTSISP